jgi:hypothetical protein
MKLKIKKSMHPPSIPSLSIECVLPDPSAPAGKCYLQTSPPKKKKESVVSEFVKVVLPEWE